METKPFTYKISLTGDLGSGKSTVVNLISERVGAEVVSVGGLQRSIAREMGMTTVELNRYMETHPEIDDRLDTMLKRYDEVTGKNLLFDSRLAWNFVPSAFSVYVTTDLYEAARRVFNAHREDEGYASIREAMRKLSERRASEMRRYRTLYGLDIKNLSNYDLVVDSTSAPPEAVVDVILAEYGKYAAGLPRNKWQLSPFRLYPLVTAEEEGDVEICSYDDYYFVTRGLSAIRKGIQSGATEICCTLKHVDEKEIVSAVRLARLKDWERECGISFIRYPDFVL